MTSPTSRSDVGGVPLGEKATPGSQNDRIDHEHVLIDEVGPHQVLNQFSATHYLQLPLAFLLELGDGGRGITPEKGRVWPGGGLAERVRSHILRGTVQRILEGAVLGVPEAKEVLVRAAPENQPGAPRHPITQCGAQDLVAVGRRPTALLEPPRGGPRRDGRVLA
jgi:hypothetical protein